jgi:hypothetical protein
MITKRLLLLALLVSLSTTALADGGRLRFSTLSGPFLITLFTTPEPLTPGPVDFSVMVQDAKTGDILSDAQITLQLISSHGRVIHATANHGIATNRLLQAAEFDIPSSGTWKIHLDIHQGTQTASLDADIPVQPGSRKTILVWVFTLLPLLALLLFILHQRQKAFLARRVYKAA